MASPRITIIGDVDAINAKIADVAKQLQDVTPVLDSIGQYLNDDATERFLREETPDGETWAQSQRAAEDGGLTLTDQRHLVASITHVVDDNEMVHGSNEIYAAIQHFGGETGRNHATTITARPFIGVGARQKTAIAELLEDWVNAAGK